MALLLQCGSILRGNDSYYTSQGTGGKGCFFLVLVSVSYAF